MARSEDADARAARWEREAHDLSTQVAFLQEELALVRRKLTESPRHVRQLEERLAATQTQLARLTEIRGGRRPPAAPRREIKEPDSDPRL